MSAAAKPYLTTQEYLAHERRAEIKSEYYEGEVFAMAGGSKEHRIIAANATGALWPQMSNKPCDIYTSDMRVQVSEAGPYTYPDVTVVCGQARFADAEVDTLLNPTLIVEVLSPTTEAWDRGGKFEGYQQLPALQEYLLLAQDRPRVEQYARQAEGQRLLTVTTGLDGVVSLPSIGCELPLREVYRRISFPENAGPRR
jgi:Uma2 family endonuclease